MKKQILLSNDDGIEAPGLWAAAEALSRLGYVTVCAPAIQYSCAGRSHSLQATGLLTRKTVRVGTQDWEVYACDGTPAQSVVNGVLDLFGDGKPDLIVTGINNGENVGHSITISGTVGAALEGAAFGVPAIAASMEIRGTDFLSFPPIEDYAVAAYFTALLAEKVLNNHLPADVDVLKLDVPNNATSQTPWKITKVALERYFIPRPRRAEQGKPQIDGASHLPKGERVFPDGSDIHAIKNQRVVSVTPLSLDMTSRTSLEKLEALFSRG
ncbi:MAG TPA: 5'/3'-nucleotidase SurE [Bellilinea sp.]|nr:5'/3'-nucleotidase SurE [Bellilinea sp.]